MMNSLAGYPLDELSCVWVMLLCMLKRAYCMCVVRIYKSDSRFKMFIYISPESTWKTSGLKVTKKIETSLKSALRKNGYSDQIADEIWKWYTCPTQPLKNQ